MVSPNVHGHIDQSENQRLLHSLLRSMSIRSMNFFKTRGIPENDAVFSKGTLITSGNTTPSLTSMNGVSLLLMTVRVCPKNDTTTTVVLGRPSYLRTRQRRPLCHVLLQKKMCRTLGGDIGLSRVFPGRVNWIKGLVQHGC